MLEKVCIGVNENNVISNNILDRPLLKDKTKVYLFLIM